MRIELFEFVYLCEAPLQFQAQHLLALSVGNDRLRIARPRSSLVRTVEFDAATVDLDLFLHKIRLSFRVCDDVIARILPNRHRAAVFVSELTREQSRTRARAWLEEDAGFDEQLFE